MLSTLKKHKIEWLLIAIGFSFILSALIYKPGFIEVSHISWYQRSGAVAVMLSILVGFRITSQSLIDENFKKYVAEPNIRNQVKSWNEKTSLIINVHSAATSLALAGTITWAYGDLIYKYVA